MRQAYVPEAGKILYREIEKPVVEDHEVCIRVARIGICGSDVHVFRGKHPLVSFPLVQGHEFSGYVDEIGKDVQGLQKGDLVTVEPAIGCGKCPRCKQGFFAQCDHLRFIGGSLPGAGSEFFNVDARFVVKMPPGTSLDDAAMVEPLAVAVHSVRKADVTKGDNLLILGAGTIGNLTAQVAKNQGADKVIVVDTNTFRTGSAEKLGFLTIDPKKVASVDGEVGKLLGGKNVTVAFECAGSEVPLNTCIRAVSRGSTVVVVGVYEEAPRAEMILVQDKEIKVQGSLMYTWSDYGEAVELIQKESVNLKILQTHHFPFDRWLDAYTLLLGDNEKVLKVLIDME